MKELSAFPKITPSEALGRVVVAGIPVGAMIALGAWLVEGDLLTWFSTMIVMTGQALLGSPLRGVEFTRRNHNPDASGSRIGGLIDALAVWLASKLLLRLLNANFVFILGRAIAFGIAIATFEQGVSGVLRASLGWPPFVIGLVSLSLVLFPIYLSLNYLREKRAPGASPEVAGLWIAIERAVGSSLGSVCRAAIAALVAVAGAVVIRATVIALLPLIFASVPGKFFFGLIALWFIVIPEMPVALLRMLVAASRADAGAEETDSSNERNAS